MVMYALQSRTEQEGKRTNMKVKIDKERTGRIRNKKGWIRKD
jgi:hypothetical protein